MSRPLRLPPPPAAPRAPPPRPAPPTESSVHEVSAPPAASSIAAVDAIPTEGSGRSVTSASVPPSAPQPPAGAPRPPAPVLASPASARPAVPTPSRAPRLPPPPAQARPPNAPTVPPTVAIPTSVAQPVPHPLHSPTKPPAFPAPAVAPRAVSAKKSPPPKSPPAGSQTVHAPEKPTHAFHPASATKGNATSHVSAGPARGPARVQASAAGTPPVLRQLSARSIAPGPRERGGSDDWSDDEGAAPSAGHKKVVRPSRVVSVDRSLYSTELLQSLEGVGHAPAVDGTPADAQISTSNEEATSTEASPAEAMQIKQQAGTLRGETNGDKVQQEGVAAYGDSTPEATTAAGSSQRPEVSRVDSQVTTNESDPGASASTAHAVAPTVKVLPSDSGAAVGVANELQPNPPAAVSAAPADLVSTAHGNSSTVAPPAQRDEADDRAPAMLQPPTPDTTSSNATTLESAKRDTIASSSDNKTQCNVAQPDAAPPSAAPAVASGDAHIGAENVATEAMARQTLEAAQVIATELLSAALQVHDSILEEEAARRQACLSRLERDSPGTAQVHVPPESSADAPVAESNAPDVSVELQAATSVLADLRNQCDKLRHDRDSALRALLALVGRVEGLRHERRTWSSADDVIDTLLPASLREYVQSLQHVIMRSPRGASPAATDMRQGTADAEQIVGEPREPDARPHHDTSANGDGDEGHTAHEASRPEQDAKPQLTLLTPPLSTRSSLPSKARPAEPRSTRVRSAKPGSARSKSPDSRRLAAPSSASHKSPGPPSRRRQALAAAAQSDTDLDADWAVLPDMPAFQPSVRPHELFRR